ncbi:MAG: DUF92 domain-containing protein [Chloroflexota bacterium]
MWVEINFNQVILGAAFSLVISLAALRLKALTTSGAFTAFWVGVVTFGVGGWGAAAVLLTFFISSSLLSQMFRGQKQKLEDTLSKGAQRDGSQVFANGGVASVCLLLQMFFPGSILPLVAFAGSLAAANADTWATELGVLSAAPPRLLTTWKTVARGVSGGVSGLGMAASFAGAGLAAGAAALGFQMSWRMLVSVWVAGVCGSLFDSLLGASLQAVYYCNQCQLETERYPHHRCGERTVYLHGIRWLNNDGVNLACTLLGGLTAVVFYLFLS